MKSEPSVPAYFLRLPWQIILRFADTERGQGLFKHINDAFEEVPTKTSAKEKDLNSELEIKFENFFQIKHNFNRRVCYAIERHWYEKVYDRNEQLMVEGIGNLSELFKKVIKKNKKYNLEGKSQFQEKIDLVLREHPDSEVKSYLAKLICGLALDICKGSSVTKVKEPKYILKILEKISQLNAQKVTKGQEITRNLEIDAINFPKEFEQTEWQCYERKDSTRGSKWGISVSIVNIGKPDDGQFIRIYDKIKSPYEASYEGIGKLHTHALYLEVALSNTSTPGKPAYYFMKVGKKTQNQTIMVGYSWKFSRHFDRYLAKTVIWKKPSLEEIKPYEQGKDDRLIPFNWFDELQENKVSKEIRRFLYNRKRNRMSMPDTVFTIDANDRENSLQSWQRKRFKDIEDDHELIALTGNYSIFYQNADLNVPLDTKNDTEKLKVLSKFITRDILEISFNPDAVSFEASYELNKYLGGQEINIKFQGKVKRFGPTIQILLEQLELDHNPNKEILDGSTTKVKYMYLSFASLKTSAKKQYYRGIINMVNENQNGPVAYRCLLLKEERSNNLTRKKQTKGKIPDPVVSYFIENIDKKLATIMSVDNF